MSEVTVWTFHRLETENSSNYYVLEGGCDGVRKGDG